MATEKKWNQILLAENFDESFLDQNKHPLIYAAELAVKKYSEIGDTIDIPVSFQVGYLDGPRTFICPITGKGFRLERGYYYTVTVVKSC
jgi:hypothetical protein